MYKIITLPSAYEDLREIKKYLAQFYPSTPKKFIALYKQKTTTLEKTPYICEKFEEEQSYRRMVIVDYLVFYKVDEEQKTVKIHRVLHGSRDSKRHLK